ncbi:antitoxin Xre/MbcA/ParS toxin-binding domain-containing protein [Zooshikella harenae]|uniref:DUF2384 domain-containing protein n=1 Tax=Zooshikella harenae TaxID=2827238 RepID=A0ABS5ZJF7_9GAMM|nr:antitoxin Xre/MbcA/ParS toxin-binding domain-containing protein [Zooshikella harenae]MBU2714221.1 DUF2384 domain-containing protein [Zooshikella harenae]
MRSEFISDVIGKDGNVHTDPLVAALHITKVELALATGLSADAVSKKSRALTRKSQTRLREVIEIINRILPWTDSVYAAFAWYRSQPLPSFGGLTAEDLVKQGKAEAVRKYLSRIAEGGYA